MSKPRKGEVGGRLRLDDLGDRELPKLMVSAVADDGSTIASATVDDDGWFGLKADAVDKAHRIVIGPADRDEADRSAVVTYRSATLRAALELGELALGPRDWGRFLSVRRCADATIRKCWFWFLPTLPLGGPLALSPLPPIWPPVPPFPPLRRCAPICEGVVEVYRRTCCCRPPIFDPPFDPPFDLPEIDPPLPDPPFPDPPFPDPFPGPIPGPQPGPDPAPFEVTERVLTGGALDVRKVRLASDLAKLRTLRGVERHEFLVARRYLWCTCGAGTKVGQGFVGEDGRIHVCWREPLRFHLPDCHDEYSFVVKQNIGGSTVTVYDGPAAGQWFDAGTDPDLTTFHPFAIACRDEPFPADPGGAYVVLQDIGATESHQLRTPDQNGADSVFAGGPTSGMLDVGTDHALGGTLHLRYHFSDGMQTMGARYYRVTVAAADSSGNPVGPWETIPVPTWDTWRSTGATVERGSHALGPHTVGAESDLFHIPFDTGAPLAGNEEWQGGQFHARLDTAARAHGRHLVRIEVFDGAGNRLEPANDPFTFRRWRNPTDTDPVPFGALTHLFLTNNQPVVADIVDVDGPGAGAGDCKFFRGPSFVPILVRMRAYHPAADPPSLLHSWTLRVRRGISAVNASAPRSDTNEVGQATPHTEAYSIGDLLDGEDRCTFTANLSVHALIHNGFGRLTGYDRHDQASFAVERTGFFPVPSP